MQKNIFVVTITRGRKTRFSYGERLKDALAVAAPRHGETFVYARFTRGTPQKSRWLENGIYETAVV